MYQKIGSMLRQNYVNTYPYSKVPRFKLESNDPTLEFADRSMQNAMISRVMQIEFILLIRFDNES